MSDTAIRPAAIDRFAVCAACPFKAGCEREPGADGTCPRKPIGTGSFRLVKAGSVAVQPPNWLVKGFIERNSFCVLYGLFGSLKSFIGLDLTFSVGSGTPWQGRKVSQGPVVYIAGEGYSGLARRRLAWEKDRKIDLSSAPIYFSTCPASLVDPASLAEVSAVVGEVAKIEGPPALIVIDTWSRNIGGDENSSLDSAAAVAALDRLRSAYGSAVLVIHHEGWQTGRTRGSTVLMGAVDTAYRSERAKDGIARLTCEKMKDGSPPEPMAFGLKNVDLGLEDEDGTPITSAVILEQEYTPPACPAKPGRPAAESGRALAELNKYPEGVTLDRFARALDPLLFVEDINHPDPDRRGRQEKYKHATAASLARLIAQGLVKKRGRGPAAIYITIERDEAGQLGDDEGG